MRQGTDNLQRIIAGQIAALESWVNIESIR